MGLGGMRGKACSAEFMRRIDCLVKAHNGSRKELVKALTHQTCLKQVQVYQWLRSLELEKQSIGKFQISENRPI